MSVKNAQRIMGTKYRGGHRRCSIRRRVLKIFVNFTEKHLCQSLFLKKLQASDKKETLEHVLQNTCEQLLLEVAIARTTPRSLAVIGDLSPTTDHVRM